jgi:hypothetical protein
MILETPPEAVAQDLATLKGLGEGELTPRLTEDRRDT